MTRKADPIEAQVKAAKARYDKAPQGSDAKKQAGRDLAAAERTHRAARRDAGEPLISEAARAMPVTMGMLEDLLAPVAVRLKGLTDRMGRIEAKPTKGASR